MYSLILSSIAAFLLISAGVYSFARRRTAAGAVLLFCLCLLAAVDLIDDMALRLDLDFDSLRFGSLIAESLLPLSFFLLTLLYGRSRPFAALPKFKLAMQSILALAAPVILALAGTDLYYSQDVRIEQLLFLSSEGYWFYLSIMGSLIVSLTNIEITLTSADGMTRNQTKFEVFGLVGLLSVQILYYSQALLHRTIDLSLGPIRSSVLILAGLLIGYSNAFRGAGQPVSVSRHVFYRSFTLLVVGIYLIGLAVVGEGMRYFGVSFGRDLTLVIAFAGGLLVLAILFSEKARGRAKVYIHKNFFGNKHDYREQWVSFTERLSSCATLPDVREAVVSAFRETFGLAGGSLYLASRDEKHLFCEVRQAMQKMPPELVLSPEVRDYFVNRQRVLNLSDREHPLTPDEKAALEQAEAFLMVPLIIRGRLEGLVALREQLVPAQLIYDDYDLMKVMAGEAVKTIANYRLSEEITEMRAMAAVAKVSSFVIHDLKNLTSNLSLVVANAQQHMNKPEFQQDAIRTISNTLARMNDLTQRLKSIPEKTKIELLVQDLDKLTRETVEEIAKTRSTVNLEYSGAPALAVVDEEEIRKVLVNLVQNAVEASGEKANIKVITGRENSRICITVSDSGAGMSKDFIRNQLFKPFHTTKKNGLGIGLYQCRQIVEAYGGRIEVSSEENKGSVFAVFLPAASENDPQGGDAEKS